MTTTINRNDKRREQTRQKLVNAATELFISKGYSETTVDEICALADVAKVTFYYHFQSKDDIVLDIKTAAARNVFFPVVQLLESNAPALHLLKVLFDGIACWTEVNWRLLQVFLGQKFQHVATNGSCTDDNPDSLLNLLIRIVEHGKRTGEFKQSVATTETASLIALTVLNQQLLWLNNERKGSLSENFERCAEFVLHGIATRD
jgi:AcrR family transcriptional regulator